MRSRMMRAPESGCERWGSLLHDLWDANAGWRPHRMVSRLFLREAGLDGCGSDEAVVREIALALQTSRRMNPSHSRDTPRSHAYSIRSRRILT